MKTFILVVALVGLGLSYSFAQDKGKDTKYKRFSLPNIDLSLQDSLQKREHVNLDSYILNRDNSIAIPNVYTKKDGESYTMPIKKLSGEDLAPMPGTENLSLLESRNLKDSINLRIKKAR